MVDFKELDKNGVQFELLIREILIKLDFDVKWAGVGPDRGKDLLVEERHDSVIGNTTTKWLVQCKHNAHSEKSVGLENIGDFVSACHDHDVNHYLLVCSTQPSASLLERFENIAISKKITIAYWDATRIEKFLNSIRFYDIFQIFFPESSKSAGIRVFATINPNEWILIHKGYYIILENRILSSSLECSHSEIKEVISEINKLEKKYLTENEMLMPRKIWYNGKSPEFIWHIDYLYDTYSMKGHALSKTIEEIKYMLKDGFVRGDGQGYNFDIQVVPASFASDHFHENHFDYYDVVSKIRGQDFSFNKKIYNLEFVRFRSNIESYLKNIATALSATNFFKVLNVVKDRTENIFNLSINMSWHEMLESGVVDSSSEFFGPKLIVATNNEEKLLELFSDLFHSIDENNVYFDLVKRFVYSDKLGNGDITYDIKFKVMFAANYLDYLVKLESYLKQLERILLNKLT